MSGSLRILGDIPVTIGRSGLIVVLTGTPGTASVIAQAIDESSLHEQEGTLAGDNTLLVLFADESRLETLARAVRGHRRPLRRFKSPVKKVVLAYSGGLDTSVAVAWLREQFDVEVVTLTVDLGRRARCAPASSSGRCPPAPPARTWWTRASGS